ncbi:MAG: hypothetical protein A4E35_00298 [Methanoregula sp. PtaU1.Bin051]|nr:MAG: hypothetical protein A4E35_00298 [Methanoregula sp. PtaU1.Bin051]
MSSLVSLRFSEWTKGLDEHQSMISIFYHIRDIPYSLRSGSRFHDPVQAGELLLETGRGSCTPKHYLLAEMFKRLNVPVVFATFPFLWNDQKIRYPPELRDLASGLPVAYHLACRVQLGCRWVLVDATWDPPLGSFGFPVNAHWDGYADTKCAVTPLKAPVRIVFCRTLNNEPYREPNEAAFTPLDGEKDHWEAEDREHYYHERINRRTPKERGRAVQFYQKLDVWMERIRNEEQSKKPA